MKSDFKDSRDKTYATRVGIGFPKDKEDWQIAPAIFSQNKLIINEHPVMEDWERDYMRELAGVACRNAGRVLEVGFGMGISAEYVQSYPIEEHVIIEANEQVFDRLTEFASTAVRPVTPVLGFWQDVTGGLPAGSFSGILFDTYPLSQDEIHKNHFYFFEEAYRLLKPGGVLTYYSDEVEDFSPEHRQKLIVVGFRNIDKTICRVDPPKDCQYWQSPTIVVPIIRK